MTHAGKNTSGIETGALSRVPRETTCHASKRWRVERQATLFPAPGYCDEEMLFFRATALHEPAVDSMHRPDEDEDISVHPTTVAEARAMLARGDIVDLKTAYALTLI